MFVVLLILTSLGILVAAGVLAGGIVLLLRAPASRSAAAVTPPVPGSTSGHAAVTPARPRRVGAWIMIAVGTVVLIPLILVLITLLSRLALFVSS